MWPRIVAESLRRVPDARAVRPGREPIDAPIAVVQRLIASAREPARSTREAPNFLLPGQHDSWRRVMAALDTWAGALLLEPVGSGKTWIALAAAASTRQEAVAIVPAILRAQWRDTAARAGVALQIHTHERASRGITPRGDPRLVIIDEAHRFRDPGTRRIQCIAPWLVGRSTLALTATPIVNRIDDLVALLRLVLPEDALALDGISSLEQIAEMDSPPVALRRVAIRSAASTRIEIPHESRLVPPSTGEDQRGERAVAAISRLALSSLTATRRLLQSVLLDAAASSDAAFHASLGRYRALLLQARDAGHASRSMLRHFAGAALEQLVLWDLIGTDNAVEELPQSDLDVVTSLLACPLDDATWIDEIAALCDDSCTTIYFTRHHATAQALRRALGDDAAWLTGNAAGIGAHRLPREQVLAAFGSQRAAWRARRRVPHRLVATDVAAEGLDLHAAGRLVHIDLPWTATRLEQREGRLLRLGQQHARVGVIVRLPPAAIEVALAPHARVRRKRRVAERWLSALEFDEARVPLDPVPRVAIVASTGLGAIAAVRLTRGGRSGTIVLRRNRFGEWLPVHERLSCSSRACDLPPDSSPRPELAQATRAAILACESRDCAPRALVVRIHRMARLAAGRRDGNALGKLDRLLRFATASPTLGARIALARLAAGSDAELLRQELPECRNAGLMEARLAAAILER